MEKYYELGKVLGGKESFRLLEEDLNRHIAVFGDIGSGKSRFLWQLLREHRRNRRGFCLIDPGDLWMDFLADCAKEVLRTGDRKLLKKIHLVQLSPFQMPRYDPFRFVVALNVHPELRESARICWQHTKVMSVSEVFQRKNGQMDFEGMPRLQRIMTDVFTMVSTLVDGRHLSIAQGQILLDMNHPHHDEIYRRLAESGKIPREVLADFDVLHAMRRVEDQRRETESGLNRLRGFGPALNALLSGTGNEPSLDLKAVIERGDYLIVNVSKSLYASDDQNAGLAGLMIHDVCESMLTARREERRPFTLIIDEAHKYIAPDIGTMMRVARKYELGVVTSMPDLAGLVRKDVDLTAPILGIPNTKIAFRMTLPDDTEKMARILYSGDLDFAPLMHEQEQHSHIWQKMQERSWSINAQKSKGTTETNQTNETINHTDSRSQGTSQGTSSQQSKQESKGAVETLSKPKHGDERPEQQSKAKSGTSATGSAQSTTLSQTAGVSSADGWAKGTSHGVAKQEGDAEGASISVSEKMVMVPVITRVPVLTGQLEKAINDQLEKKRQAIVGRADRHATAKCPGSTKAIEFETIDVQDPFPTATDTMKMVEWIQRELVGVHDYYHTPNFDPAEQDRALEEQLNRPEGDQPEYGDRPHELDEEEIQENPLDG